MLTAKDLELVNDGDLVKVAGLVLVRQRPGTANGICFITLEDETGTMNLVIFKNLFNVYRKEIIQSRLLMVEGRLQKEGQVTHVIVSRCFNISSLLGRLTATNEELPVAMSRSDETSSPFLEKKKSSTEAVIQGNLFGDGRNFR